MTDNKQQVVAGCIRELENRYDLFKYLAGDWCAWQIVRPFVHIALMAQASDHSPSGNRAAKWIRFFFETMGYTLRDLSAWLFAREAKFLVKMASSGRRIKEGNLYKDPFWDDFLKSSGSYYKIEQINNPIFLYQSRHAYLPSNITTSAFDNLSAILGLLSWHPEWERIASLFSKSISENLGLKEFTPRRITQILNAFYWEKQCYKALLQRVAPRFVLLSNYGEYALLAAAHEMGIKVVEFQHGFYGSYQDDSLSAEASAYRQHLLVPDRILMFGDYWKTLHDDNGFFRNELRPVGTTVVDAYRARRKEALAIRQGKCCKIVLTTGMPSDLPALGPFIIEFLKLAKGRLDLRLYIKLHPTFEKSKEPYKAIFGSDDRVTLLLGSEDPSTYDLLTLADFHFSISSTTHYEALALGVPTAIIDILDAYIVHSLYNDGHAFLARTSQELLDIVIDKWQSWQVPETVSAWYYKPGALQNIQRELEELAQAP